MELVGTAWEVAKCLWACSKRHAGYICDLEDNLTLLTSLWRDLESISQDLKIRVDEAEKTKEMRRKNEVKNWLDKVDAKERVIKDIQVRVAQEIQNKCPSNSCSKNCVSSYKLGQNVDNMLQDVRELITDGRRLGELAIAHMLPQEPVDEMPVDRAVGLDLMLDTVLNSIKEENVGIIGLYGMGGVGKTTLLEQLYSELAKKEHDFAEVLSVVVSKDCDTDRIMNDIRCCLGIDEESWNESNKRRRVSKIYKNLKEKKFILLLDDLWEKLELKKVGIPLPGDANYQSKVLFTTRSEDVCAKMQAQKAIKVECLSDDEAFDLFCMKVGRETLECHRDIPKLARQMARECKGLPLALITVGSAMAGVTSVQAWEDAKNDLTSSPWTASDLEKEVFSILKFSYDRLPDEAHRKCFLYCALYPDDYEINVPDLIYRWIGEGFLGDQTESIYDLYRRGESVIKRLQLSSLLETDDSVDDLSWNRRVKMHDVMRDMAIWISRDQDQNKTKILVQRDALAVSRTHDKKWKVVERISVTDCEGDLHVPACPNLLTLIVSRNGSIKDLANIKSMGRLKVLDLSYNKELKLPVEIGHLIHLEYLNLSESRFASRLPMELKLLRNLKIFLLQRIRDCTLEIIPLEVISSLEQLRVFRFSEFKSDPTKRYSEERAFLEKLDSLPNLEEILLQLGTDNGLKQLLEPTKLQTSVRFLLLSGIETPINMPLLLESISRMEHLEGIQFTELHFNTIDDTSMVETCHFDKLRWVDIRLCNSITHLTWLKHAPLLEILWVVNCDSIEEVIKGTREDEVVDNIFSYLAYIYLGSLPKLKSIHMTALPFRSLKYIQICECPSLTKLPFDSSSTAKDSLISLRGIRGSQEWCDHLEWQNPATENVFRSKLRVMFITSEPSLVDPFSPFGYQPYFDAFDYDYGYGFGHGYGYGMVPSYYSHVMFSDENPNACSIQ